MKKNYFEPEIEIVEFGMNATLLAGSDIDVTEEDYENIGGEGDAGAIAE